MSADVLVTFCLAGQLCGLPVEAVRDVLRAPCISPIPLAPPEIAGSLNLRGRIVTAIDLHRRLGLPAAGSTDAAGVCVVAELGGELYALLVDQVGDVVSPPPDSFDRNPATLADRWAGFSNGIYRMEDRLMVVLDIARLLALAPA
jgi:purine-binding chemotaxis protein CheW